MPEQLTLDAPPMARRSDSAGSHEAADKLEASGDLNRRQVRALRGLLLHTYRTAAELAQCMEPSDEFARYKLQQDLLRRLPELHANGYAEPFEQAKGPQKWSATTKAREWEAAQRSPHPARAHRGGSG